MSGQEIRASGYYWVRRDGCEWAIAEFDDVKERWWMDGLFWRDSDMTSIDENRIMRDAERLAIYLEAKKTDKLNDQESKCS